MQRIGLFIALLAFSLVSPQLSFAYDDYGSYDESGYYGNRYDNYYDRREAYNDNNNYYYSSDRYDDGYYYQRRRAQRARQYYYDNQSRYRSRYSNRRRAPQKDNSYYMGRLPEKINTSEKVIVVDPSIHAWGAYGADGNLVKGGLVTAGANYCPDIGRSCRTKVGSFRISSLGSSSCYSRRYPVGRGGAPMPYCMYFNKNQALHGSNQVVAGNVSHGCVRLRVNDAEWIRFNFANVGTKVIVKPY